MTTTWAHLPNAVHMDRIWNSFKSDPELWHQIYSLSHLKVESYDINSAWDKMFNFGFNDVRGPLEHKAPRPGFYSVELALLALYADDECAYMLDSDPGEVEILAAFGNPIAILMLMACKVFAKEKELA